MDNRSSHSFVRMACHGTKIGVSHGENRKVVTAGAMTFKGWRARWPRFPSRRGLRRARGKSGSGADGFSSSQEGYLAVQ